MPRKDFVPVLSCRDAITSVAGSGLGLLLAAPLLVVSAQEAFPAATQVPRPR